MGRTKTNLFKKTAALRLFQFALVIAFALLTVSTQLVHAAATDAPEYVSQFGSSGTGDGQFDGPANIATDSSGNSYVIDSNNNRIQKFNSAGVYQSQFGSNGSGDGQFSVPFGVALDSSGNIYVADGYNSRIQKFNSAGVYQSQFGSIGSGDGEFSVPNGIAIDSSDNIYVADGNNSRIQKFNSAGVYQSQFGSSGSGDGQFSFYYSVFDNPGPVNMAIDSSGNIYVPDIGNNRVQKFNSSGTFVAKWGSFGTGNGQFSAPTDIVVDGAGNVYVADSGNNRVQKFDSSGSYLAQWGSSGSGNGQFSTTFGLGIDSLGNILVSDNGNNRVQKFAYPADTASLTGTSGKDVQLDTLANVTLTCNSISAESSLDEVDAGYSYPLDLVNYCLTVPSAGSTTTMSITFETDLEPSQVTARKYNSNTGVYADVPNATITETTLNGNHALLLSYEITDGGSLDEDGLANGSIVDPVGLAVTDAEVAASASLADTGQNANVITFLAIASIVTAVGIILVQRQRIHTTKA